jgi:hypothetical protein
VEGHDEQSGSPQQAGRDLFDDENRHLGEGYEINDPDQGHVISIVWKNA